MYVPNYIPQPIEIPGNITDDSWTNQLKFLRLVTKWHLGTVIVLILFTYLPHHLQLPEAITTAFLSLLILSFTRIFTRGTAWDLRVSTALLFPVLYALSAVVQILAKQGWPTWAPIVGLGYAAAYTALCGRDFSFMGQYLLALVLSSVAIAVVAVSYSMPNKEAALAMALNALYLTFYCYDLASLMSRRRKGEEFAASIDLYRDVFNLLGWCSRCISHWRKHQIWQLQNP